MTARSLPRLALMACSVLFAGYFAFALSIGNAPLQDLPDHLTRAHIIGDLLFDGGAAFAGLFKLQIAFNPYLFGDLLLAVLERALGTEWAARLWIAAAILLLPLSIRFVLKKQGASPSNALTGAILGLYLATGWFFVMGFINYLFGFACALFAYGWFLEAQQKAAWRPYLFYALMVILSYAFHLSALIFVCAIVGVSVAIAVLRRNISIRRGAALMLAPYLLFLFNLAVGVKSAPGAWPTSWGTWQTKLFYLGSPIVRFSLWLDTALFLSVAAVVLFPLLRKPLQLSAQQSTDLVMVPVFLALYLVLPSYTGNVYSVDVRAIPYAIVFALFAGLAVQGSPRAASTRLALASLIAGINLAYLALQVLPQNAAMGRYKQVAASLPFASHVLPIYTLPAMGRYRPFMTAGSYATLESGALTPYMFAADLNPPMTYFSFVHRDVPPSPYWYPTNGIGKVNGTEIPPNWPQIQQQFQYLLITVPWNKDLISLPYRVVKSNDVVALLRIEKQ